MRTVQGEASAHVDTADVGCWDMLPALRQQVMLTHFAYWVQKAYVDRELPATVRTRACSAQSTAAFSDREFRATTLPIRRHARFESAEEVV